MQKLVLVSILAVSIVAPIVAAQKVNARRSLRALLVWTVAGIAVYVACVLFIYPRLQ
jgi:hypothetical protein